MYNLFLDDVRDANTFLQDTRTWVTVRNYNEFVKMITERGIPSYISFDHDLADEHYANMGGGQFNEKTGYDCAKWLVEFCLRTKQILPDWRTHSMNPVGRKNIDELLLNYRKNNL